MDQNALYSYESQDADAENESDTRVRCMAWRQGSENMNQRQMHLVAYLKTGPTAMHVGGWRHPESTLDDILHPSRYEHIARVLEAGKFDGCFFADLFGLYDIHGGSFDAYVRRGGQISFLDPTVVLPIMAAATKHLGLGATLSTSFHTPYHLARWLSSLDVLSGGRVAWNVVTSATDLEAQNAGLDQLPPREERYDRADEALEACFALWNSWDEGAFVLDKASGVFADPAKVHYANYEGRWVKTRGPLSIPRSPQGRPVIMQAGSSDRGREFAARWAEVVFTIQRGHDEMREFYQDLKARMALVGRKPHECAILPAVAVVLGETESIARERADYLNSLIDPELSVASSSSGLGADLTKLKDDTKLADLQGNQGMKGTEQILQQTMQADGLTLAQAAVKRNKGRELVGTPVMIADRLQEMFEGGVCDGFVLAPTMFPGMFEQFCRGVVPELQRRGIFRKEYTGRTLRENLQG
jgi:FMN-dependent oxidoreductase (nitrilotriacetate monooxygenase family)